MWRTAVLITALGCSSPSGSRPDAPPIVDPPIDAPEGAPFKLTVTKNGIPQPGVLVFVGDDGYLVPGVSMMTDANGVITGYGGADTYNNPVVTAVNPFGTIDANTDELFTFEMVRPGDELVLAKIVPAETQVTLTFPADAGATSYRLHTNCGASDVTSGTTITLRGCGATLDALLESREANGTSRGWLYQADVALASAVTLAGTYQPAVTEQLSFMTLNVTSPTLGIQTRLATAKGIVYTGPQITMPISFMNYEPTYAVVRPTIPGATALTDIRFGFSQYSAEHFVDWYPASVPTHAFDLRDGGLAHFASEVTFDRGTRRLSYTYSGGQVLTDAHRITVDFTRTGDRSWRWHMLAPAGTRGPTLPTQPHDWNTATASTAQLVEAMQYSVPGGYDAVRENGFAIDPTSAKTGATGRLYYQTPAP